MFPRATMPVLDSRKEKIQELPMEHRTLVPSQGEVELLVPSQGEVELTTLATDAEEGHRVLSNIQSFVDLANLASKDFTQLRSEFEFNKKPNNFHFSTSIPSFNSNLECGINPDEGSVVKTTTNVRIPYPRRPSTRNISSQSTFTPRCLKFFVENAEDEEENQVLFISPSSPKLIFDIEHAGNMADAELKGWSKLEWSNQVFATNEMLLNSAALRIQCITRMQQAQSKVKKIKIDKVALEVEKELQFGDEDASDDEMLDDLRDSIKRWQMMRPSFEFQYLAYGQVIDRDRLMECDSIIERKKTKAVMLEQNIFEATELAAEPWEMRSECSDFIFDLDFDDFGVVTAVDVMDTPVSVDTKGLSGAAETALDAQVYEAETIPMAAQLGYVDTGMLKAMAGWLAVLEADKKEALEQLEQAHAQVLNTLESRLQAEQQQLLAAAEVAKLEAGRVLKALQSDTAEWKATMMDRLRYLEAGTEAGRMRKLEADLEAALSRVERLEYELREARQESDQSSEDEQSQLLTARSEPGQPPQVEEQLATEAVMDRLRELEAGMEAVRLYEAALTIQCMVRVQQARARAREKQRQQELHALISELEWFEKHLEWAEGVVRKNEEELKQLRACDVRCLTESEKVTYADDIQRLSDVREDALVIRDKCHPPIKTVIDRIHAIMGYPVASHDDKPVDVVMNQEPQEDGGAQASGSLGTSRKRRNRRRQRMATVNQ